MVSAATMGGERLAAAAGRFAEAAGRFGAAAALVLMLASCGKTNTQTAAPAASQTEVASQTHDTAADLAEITGFNARYLKSINDGDFETLSRMTDEDHMMVLVGREPISGKAANDAANRRVLEQFDIDETWTPLETVIDRNLAYQRGTWTVAATPKAGGETRHSTGQFVRIYQRLNGSWWMTRDVLLSDPPKDAAGGPLLAPAPAQQPAN